MVQGVSILVCCFNSEERLPETLRHLFSQLVPSSVYWEIIVIDNNSIDDTTHVAKQAYRNYQTSSASFRIIHEPIPGKKNAIKKGVDLATYEYLIICDDDNWLHNDYVANAFEIMQNKMDIGVLGGYGYAVADSALPDWFGDYEGAYAVGRQNDISGDIFPKKNLYGAGMVFRKSLFDLVYTNFSPLFDGPEGSVWSPGEDVEFCFRVLMLDYKLYFDEKLIFKHYLTSNKLTETYRDMLMHGHMEERHVLNLYGRQVDIHRLSAYNKKLLLISSFIRFIIGWVTGSLWNNEYEAETIFFLIGVELFPVSNDCKKIRAIDKNLTRESTFRNENI